jgi:putative aldouronate transport system substrate-binding protein
LLSAFGFVNPLHDIKDGKYIYVPAQPAYKSYLEYLNKLYVEKLLDNEYFSQTPQQILAKQSAGTIGFMDANPYSVLPNEVDYMKYDSLGPLTSSANSVKMWPANTAFNRAWGIFAMTKKSKYPEAAVRLIDYFYTTEGSRAVRVGPLFGSWEGDGGYQILEETATNVKAKLIMPGFTSYWAWRNAKAGPTGQPFMSNDLVNDIIVGADKKNSQLTSWIFNSGCREVRKFGYPEVSFTAEEQRKISSFVDMDNYVSMMDAKFITGEIKFDEWNRYLAELKRLGLDDMVAVRQGAYQRYESTPTDL